MRDRTRTLFEIPGARARARSAEPNPEARLAVIASERRVELHMAVADVFERMLYQPCIATQHAPAMGDTISASIRLTGRPEGMCTVEVPVAAGDRLTDALLGSEADWDDEMIDDAVGELCNMITGGIKGRLGIRDGLCTLSLPSVVRRPSWQTRTDGPEAVRRSYVFGPYTMTVVLELE